MNSIQISGVKRQVPGRWGELSARQLERVVLALRGSLELEEMRVKIFARLWVKGWWDLPAQWVLWQLMRGLYVEDKLDAAIRHDYVEQLLQQVDWVLKENDLVTNPYPKVKAGYWWNRLTLLGPDDGLSGITGGEWAWAERGFVAWVEQKDEAALNQLIAALWRPARHNYDPVQHADRRVPFSPHLVPQIECQVAQLPLARKLGMLTFYEAARKPLIEAMPKGGEGKESKLGWLGVFLELSGGVKDLDEVTHQPLELILVDIKRLLEKQAELKKKK